MSELAVPGVEIGRLSATDADLGENARMDFTIVDGEAGDTFNITGLNQEAVILLNKVGVVKQKYLQYCCFLPCIPKSELNPILWFI